MLALNFSTAASCFRRCFGLPVWAVIAITLGAALAGCFVSDDVYAALMAVTLAACVIISCWTKRFYLRLFYILLWFFACFGLTLFLFFFICYAFSDSPLTPYLVFTLPFGLAPLLFLGGLPFGDETYS